MRWRGLEMEAEAMKSCIGRYLEWRGLSRAPSGRTVPLVEVCEARSRASARKSLSV